MNSHSEAMLNAIENNDLAESQLQFEKALREDSPDVLAQLGEQLFAAGFLVEAEMIFKQLLTQFPTEKSLAIYLAEIAIENDELEQAFDYLEAIPADHPTYVESLLVLADLYQMMGVPEVSEQKIKEAQKLLPEESLLTFALAELYNSNDRLNEAIPLYQELLAQGVQLSNQVDLKERLGSAYSMSGQFEEAIPLLEEALAERQTDELLFQLGVTYIQLAEREKAISHLQQLRLLNPTFENLYLPLGSALMDENMYSEADEVMAEGLQHNPYNVDLYHLASDSAYRTGKIAEAEEFIRKAITLEEDKEFSIIKLSNLLLADERYEEVIETLSELVETGHAFVLWNLAKAYAALEEYTEAAKFYRKGAPSLINEPDFLKEYGLFLREEGEQDLSQEVLAQYLKLMPEDSEIYHLLDL